MPGLSSFQGDVGSEHRVGTQWDGWWNPHADSLLSIALEGESEDKSRATVWICLPKIHHVEMLTPKAMVLGGGTFERELVHEGGAHINAICALIKVSFLNISLPYDYSRSQQCATWKKALTWTRPCCYSNLRIPPLEQWRTSDSGWNSQGESFKLHLQNFCFSNKIQRGPPMHSQDMDTDIVQITVPK